MKSFEYQRTNRFFAQCPGKMENIAMEEIKEYGVKNLKKSYRGFWFKGKLEHLYRINFRARLVSRILAPLISFNCHSSRYLYNTAIKLDWTKLLSIDNTFAIFSNVSNSKIKHSHYATQVLKDAIADHFNNKFDKRPNVDKKNPDIWINLFIHNNYARISFDTSGGPLHKRGYRKSSVTAPMQEILAAAIIRLSGWKGDKILFDPMCGSGTLLSEALLDYCRLPSALNRTSFGFEHLPDFKPEIWKKIKNDTERLSRKLPKSLIFGNDIDKNSVETARQNINSLPYGKNISLTNDDFRNHSGFKDSIIVTNPPYGIRLGNKQKIKKLYNDFGDYLKNRCKGSTAFIYIGDRDMISELRLRPSRKIPLVNGNIDGRLVKLKIF